MRFTIAILTAAACTAAAAPALAQTRIDVTPFIGIYTALANEVDENGTTLSQTFSAAFGARVIFWTSAKVGVELGAAYAKSGVTDEADPAVAGNVMVGSLRLIYALTQGTRQCLSTVGGCQPALYASGGMGLIKRGGQAWQGVSGLTNLTGSAGAGARIPVTPSLTARIDAEFLLYPASFRFPTGPTSSRFQKDLVLTAGLWIPLAGGH